MIEAHKHLIQWGLDRGYAIEVECEGELDYNGTNYTEAVEAVEACDIGLIYLTEGGEMMAVFSYVLEYDQEPDEIIGDWGINEVSEAWDKEYTSSLSC